MGPPTVDCETRRADQGRSVLKKTLAAAALLTLTACGVSEVDIPALEESIVDGVAEDVQEDVTADCPEQVDWETGSSFDCDVAFDDGSTATAEVKMVDDEGNVEWEIVDPVAAPSE
jgi:Domain of unknown function (DUF4333)